MTENEIDKAVKEFFDELPDDLPFEETVKRVTGLADAEKRYRTQK